MPGGFVKDAFGDMLANLQRRLESVERQSSSGKVLPCHLTLSDAAGTTALTIPAEYYRHADFVQCWFAVRMAPGFSAGSGLYTVSTPWRLKAAPGDQLAGLIGQFRARRSNGSETTGQIYVVSATDPRLFLWYVTGVPVGGYQSVGSATPWPWGEGDLLQGEFRGHVLPDD